MNILYLCICVNEARCRCSRLWYKRGLFGSEKTVRQLHYLHVIPARLETHPRAFNPKFQSLDAAMDLLNEQLYSGESVINGTSICWLHNISLIASLPSKEDWHCWSTVFFLCKMAMTLLLCIVLLNKGTLVLMN